MCSQNGGATVGGQLDGALQKARDAAKAGNPMGMVEALYLSHTLDGILRRLQAKWPHIVPDELDFAVADAVDVLYQAIGRGEKMFDIVSYLWKVADRNASDYHQLRQREMTRAPADMELIPDEHQEPTDEVTQEIMREERRRQAIALARNLLPRLGQQNAQSVMGYIIDAAEADRQHVPNAEIAEALGLNSDTVRACLSRGFRRLKRIAREEGIVMRDMDYGGLDADEVADSERSRNEIE